MNKIKVFLSASVVAVFCACTDYSEDIESAHKDYIADLAERSSDSESENSSESGFSDEDFDKVSLPCGDLWCYTRKDYFLDIDNGKKADWYTEDVVQFDYLDDGTLLISFEMGEVDEDDGYAVTYDFNNGIEIEDWGGVCLVYESNVDVDLEFGYATDDGDGAWIYTPVKASHEATVMNVPWTDFLSLDMSLSISDKFDMLDFWFDGADLLEYDAAYFRLISIGRYGTCSEDSPKSSSSKAKSSSSEAKSSSSSKAKSSSSEAKSSSSSKAKSSSSETKSSSSEAEVVFNCGDLWCASDSTYAWRLDLSNENFGWVNAHKELLNFSDYGDGTLVMYPDVPSIVNNEQGYVEVYYDFGELVDISDWGGFCLIYQSNMVMRFYLEGENAVLNYAELPVSQKSSVVNLQWDDFVTDPENPENYTGSVTDPIQYVAFTMMTSDMVDSPYFALLSIGRKGTCSVK